MPLITKEISFCGGVAQNVVDVDFKVKAYELLRSYGCNVLAKHYMRASEARAAQALATQPHLLCTRSHGNPYFLLLTRYQDRNVCIFVDKKIQHGYTQPRMIAVPLAFKDAALYDDTVLEGEMVRASPSWVFLIGDVLVHAGHRTAQAALPERLALLDVAMDAHAPLLCQPCVLQAKRYFAPDRAREFVEFCEGLPYPQRGVLFKPLRAGAKDVLLETSGFAGPERAQTAPGRDAAKAGTGARTAQIARDNHPDCYHVALDGGQRTGHLHVRNLEESLFLYNTFTRLPAGRPLTMQVVWSEPFKKWELTAARGPPPPRRPGA